MKDSTPTATGLRTPIRGIIAVAVIALTALLGQTTDAWAAKKPPLPSPDSIDGCTWSTPYTDPAVPGTTALNLDVTPDVTPESGGIVAMFNMTGPGAWAWWVQKTDGQLIFEGAQAIPDPYGVRVIFDGGFKGRTGIWEMWAVAERGNKYVKFGDAPLCTMSMDYAVTRTFSKFADPVAMTPIGSPPVWNLVKPGSVVPLAFQLFEDATVGTIEVTDPNQIGDYLVDAECTSGNTNHIQTAPTGPSDLTYADGHFTKNWQAPTVPGCYQIRVQSYGAKSLDAYFKVQ